MLRRLLRALAVATLVLAIPGQGLATVSAGICMALGHHGDAAVHDHGSSTPGYPHDHGAGANHQHHDDGGSGDEKKSPAGHCAPCVSCCAAAAISSFPAAAVPEEAISGSLPAPLASSYRVAPHRLDRPPLAL